MLNKICVIIPAFDEEKSIAKVIADIPKNVHTIVVANNNSKDNTEIFAKNAGAVVVNEKKMGYGYACLAGIKYLEDNEPDTDIVVFLDGDYSDFPEQLTMLTNPITKNNFDFVIGARSKHLREEGAMTPQQVFGNWLACFLMRIIYNSKFTDLGPFRAIKFKVLQDLEMVDTTYGWTVEMQLKVLKQKLKYIEVDVNYRNRIGVSKVSGTVKGTILAGVKIIGWIVKYSFKK